MAYQTNEIEDWWKHHYNETYNGQALSSKPDTMSDADYKIGQQLYNSYVQGNKYQTDYNNAVADSAKRTEAAKISADVSRQRLEKYLPQQLALQGLYGTGMSEDSYLKLQNQYQNAVGDANAMHNQNLKDYKSTLDSQNHALWQQTTGAVNDIVDAEKADQEKIKAEQQAMFAEAKNALYEATNEAQLVEAYYAYKDKIPPEMAGLFEQIKHENSRNIIAENGEVAKATGTTIKMEGGPNQFLGNGKNLDVKINDTLYKVEADSEISDQDEAYIYAVTNNKVSHKHFFYFDGEIYVRFNDTVHRILSVDDNKKGDDYEALKNYLNNTSE